MGVRSRIDTELNRERARGRGIRPTPRTGMPSTKPFEELEKGAGKVGRAVLKGLEKMQPKKRQK